jgi:hypothetical protein
VQRGRQTGRREHQKEGGRWGFFAAETSGEPLIVPLLYLPLARRGRTALARAAAKGQADMVRLLVSKGASMLAMDTHGR